jgi:hypothetical protein
MGMSLSGDVFWGFDLGWSDDIEEDEMPQWWQNDEEWEEVLARALGWVEAPHPTWPEGLNDYRIAGEERDRIRTQFETTPEYQTWSENRSQLHSLVESIGVEIDSYGYEYGARAVRVKASAQRCDYSARRLTDLVVGPGWPEELARFCELLELRVPAEGPGWHVCASWG